MFSFTALIEKRPDLLMKALHMFLGFNKRSNCTPETSQDCDVTWGKTPDSVHSQICHSLQHSLSDYRDPLVIPSTSRR